MPLRVLLLKKHLLLQRRFGGRGASLDVSAHAPMPLRIDVSN